MLGQGGLTLAVLEINARVEAVPVLPRACGLVGVEFLRTLRGE